MTQNQRITERPKGLHRELPPGMKGVASLCKARGLSESLCELVNIASVSSANSVLKNILPRFK